MKALWRLVLVTFVLLLVCACDRDLKRPFGFHRIGLIDKYLGEKTDVPEHHLLIRRDAVGLYGMSTMCTHDLDYLKKVDQDGKSIYVCDLCGSHFSELGKVIAGPAEQNLPYYALVIDAETVGAPKETLYVRVGDEVSPDWRLKLHFVDE